ncbi:unnamed protein product [Adineta ricciae]|nr:unnamed protein product [Adineta ricciae]
MEKFLKLLNHLSVASKSADYEQEISTIVATIQANEKLLSPVQLVLPNEFDEYQHTVDNVALQYLKNASKSVQNLIPLKSLPDGNCLFNSVVSLLPDSDVSAVELRVRTIVELVKNRSHYATQYSTTIGPFDIALQRACNNYSFCELYELAALANVLRCEIQSVYPYIDYRAEMKIMNSFHKPLDMNIAEKYKLIIFWTSTLDEASTRNRPGSGGVWSPNHFVPLVQPYRRSLPGDKEESRSVLKVTPRKETYKNKQISSIRSPEFSPPPNARKHKTSFPSSTISVSNMSTYDTQRKRQERLTENEQRRRQRIVADRWRKRNARENETEGQYRRRLSTDRLSKRNARENETEDQDSKRLSTDRLSKQNAREDETEDQYRRRLSTDRLSKQNAREDETEDQHNRRLATDRLSKRNARENETEDQHSKRLSTDRLSKRNARENETEDQHSKRLSTDRLSKQNAREDETEDQHSKRLSTDRLSKQNARESETEDQHRKRLSTDRLLKQNARESETEDQYNTRVTNQQERSAKNRLSQSKKKLTFLATTQHHSNARDTVNRHQSGINSTESMRLRREQQALEREQHMLLQQYTWPMAIPSKLKYYCLEDFANHMSMSALEQSTCILCNTRAFANTMKEYALQDILSIDQLTTHTDLVNIIPRGEQHTQVDQNAEGFSSSNIVLYKRGYCKLTKTGNICQQCLSALIRDKIPMLTPANKMWVGDVPIELQQLTLAEEKLISLYRHNSCIIKLQSPFHHHSTAQAALRGNVITFMHNMPNIVTTLPLDVDDLSDTIKIIFIGAHMPDRVQFRKICGVSQQKVLSEVNIAKLPEDDVPESIWATLERIENVSDGNSERAGFTEDPLIHATDHDECNSENICPMNTSAVLDVNGTTISSEDISVHLLRKVNTDMIGASSDLPEKYTEDDDDVYMIPRSNVPIKDYFNPELLLGLYPTLFPYGCGAPQDSSRPIPVSLEQHIRYLLAYDDQRFEKHHSFMFVLFNIMQRRQACWNATLMASRPYFQNVANDLETLTSKEIETALMSISKQTFSSVENPRINMLMKQIKTVGGNVMGSAYSRAALRTQIHALIFNQGLPSIFMTINPADIHSRVALYFAGVDLDLDKIIPEKIPSTYERAQIIASHPVATARFFNALISSILKCMIQKGVLGPIKAYFGTVENQGRGSLHLHILMWLDHDLTPSQLKESVQNEEFRCGLINYLEDIIKQDLSNFDLDTSEDDALEQQHQSSIDPNETKNDSLKLIPPITPTLKPSMPNFAMNFKKDIIQIVKSCNIHIHTATCYKYSKKNNNPACRMRMPRRIETVSSINVESGEIKLKRLHETINNFNEYIISACRSNMDIKYIFSGSDAKALVYYITDYVTKSSLSFHDTFSLVLKAIQSFEKQKLHMNVAVNAEEKSRRLVLRCYNTLASQQELSGVQVASYLMGWPDHYTTHEFVNLFLIGIENYLQSMLSEAKLKQQHQTENITNIDDDESCHESEEQFLLQPTESNNKYVYVNTRVDYQYRSVALDNICLYDYVRSYRKKPIDAKDRRQLEALLEPKDIQSESSKRGRPPSERELFQDSHPQAASHINIKRTKPVIPVLIGPPIPRKDREDTRERYCRSILTLFHPWRTYRDVCDVDQSWEEAFNIRQTKILSSSWKIVNNIQLLQECKSDRDEHLQQIIEAAQTETGSDECYPRHIESDSEDENTEIFDILEAIDITNIPVVNGNTNKVEQIYFKKIVEAVDRANRFANIRNSHVGPTNRFIHSSQFDKQIISDHEHLVPATTELIQLNNGWQRKIKEQKERIRKACIGEQLQENHIENIDNAENGLVPPIEENISSDLDNNNETASSTSIIPVAKIAVPNETTRENIAVQFTLNKNQKAAFMIITGHLDGLGILSEDDKQQQLIMCVPGCGGTGKSQLIRAITAYFTQTNRAHKLRKLAPTSVAAAEIEGMTIHSFLGEGRNRKHKSKVMNRPGQVTKENIWRFVEYIILDEMSMVGLSLLARLNKLVATAKHHDPMSTMGGINIIFFGDYIQYSPVFDKPLYYNFTSPMDNDTQKNRKIPTENDIQQKSARALILQINCVVMLEEQMRTKDLAYRALLNRVRHGEGTYEDWQLLRTRVIGIGLHISLNSPPWNETPILVYRNELRTELNNRAVINKAYEMGRVPTVVIATDTIKAKKHIDLPDLTKRLLALPDNKTEHLPGYLPLVPGMPVLLQENIACELGLSNGTQGIFRELIYDCTSEPTIGSSEEPFTPDTVFVRNAQYALVEIPKSKMSKLDSLDPLIIPIPAIEKTFDVDLEKFYSDKGAVTKLFKNKKVKATISIKRKALPLIPAYSITTHKSQGQTLPKIVIDLNMPPGMVEVASAYVPLSRIQQLTDLVILQDFSIEALQVKPSKGQLAELNRLSVIFEQTKQHYSQYFV